VDVQLALITACEPGAWRDEPNQEGDIVAKVDTKIFAFLGYLRCA
jgi:hypothetical protein